MGLKEQLMQDYKDAMKSADVLKKNTVNMVRAAIKQYEVDQRVNLDDDADIVKIIKKQVKMRADALSDFAKAGRDDMVEGYMKEIEILKSYLPEEMGEEEIKARVKEIAEKLGVEANMKNMGMLMKNAMAELKDKADGSAVNKAVKEFLSGK
ncbi:MAG: GatB/YqeY domain-containing protein [Mogibacterium sp.]|nr:GatB/YqeY domain-containing protein [Mogibacterium sp.]